jgi:ribosomal protein L37AE/L43A
MPDLKTDLETTQGGRYRCPFCDARRGLSFDEDVGDSGVWHCFSCQRGGDGVELYAELRNTDLQSALDAYGISRSNLSGDVKQKEQKAPKPTTPDYTDEEWAERCRAWQAMNTEELRLRDEYRRRRAAAQERRDREAFDRWQSKLDELFEHVLDRGRHGYREVQQLDADTGHLD